MSDSRFPEGFLWGAATASYQVEGGIENCDWAKAAREGKVPPCGRACEHYSRYEEDFDIAKSLGHTCHRISIEWSRIEPSEGHFDEKEIEHYLAVIAALRARHIKPFITLWHFTLPQWFADKGGFEHPDAPEIFARYCGYVTGKLGNDCRHFATMNEPIVFASNGWRRGSWPPFRKWPLIDSVVTLVSDGRKVADQSIGYGNILRYFRVVAQLVRAHNAAYKKMKAAGFGVEVGIVHQVLVFDGEGFFYRTMARIMNWHWTHSFLRRVYRHCDSIGVNYYLYKKFGDTRSYEKTDMGWNSNPEGITEALLMLKRYGLPLWVSEAGVADAADRIRAPYIRKFIDGMAEAIARGADLRGYMYWSLLDNYEWAHGFKKRFGLVEVDFETMERTIRPSAYVYKEIIEGVAVPAVSVYPEMIEPPVATPR